MKKVLVITGCRSEYFLFRDSLLLIENSSDLDLHLVVSGAHNSRKHNLSRSLIEADGFRKIFYCSCLVDSVDLVGRVSTVSLLLSQILSFVDNIKPDVIIASCDREEALVSAILGNYLNIPTLHFSAGEICRGNADDLVRHAISRLSSYMLCTSEQSRENLLSFGEPPECVFNIGNPGLDRYRRYLELNPSPTVGSHVLVIFHPLSSQANQSEYYAEQITKAIQRANLPAIFIGSNSDPGGSEIDAVFEKYCSGRDNMTFTRCMDDEKFIEAVVTCKCIIGNSSMGIVEAPFLGIPVVNVGNRQECRSNLHHVISSTNSHDSIYSAIGLAISVGRHPSDSTYGNGHSASSVIDLIRSIEPHQIPSNKLLGV